MDKMQKQEKAQRPDNMGKSMESGMESRMEKSIENNIENNRQKTDVSGQRRTPAFRASAANELQDLEIWRIVACLPYATFTDIKHRILALSRDRSFAMNYWVKVCKLRAMKGLPMPWESIH